MAKYRNVQETRLPFLRRLKISNSFDKKANFSSTFAVLPSAKVNNPEKIGMEIDI